MSTFFSSFPFFLLLKRKGSKLDLADALQAWVFYLCFPIEILSAEGV